MYPPIKRTAPRQNKITRKSIIGFLRLLVLLITGSVLAVMLVQSRAAKSSSTKRTAEVTIQAAGRGQPYLRFQDGRRLSMDYRGNASWAIQSGEARARALATADLDGNAAPDL